MFTPQLQQNLAPKLNTNFTRTVPMMPRPLDIYKIQQNVKAMNEAKAKRREVNSYLDVYFNVGAHNRISEGKWYEKIPVINYALSSIEAFVELNKKMFNLKEPGKALMTILNNVGETLDAPALLVKAPLYALKENISVKDAYVQAFGLSDDGQEYIDFSDISGTNNFFVNLAGEILVDPVNWFTLGGSVAAKSILTKGLKEMTEEAITSKSVLGKAGDVIKIAIKKVSDEGADDVAEAATKLLVANKALNTSEDVLRHAVNYAMKQSDDIAKISNLSSRNIGSYVNRLNNQAFRGNYREFSKIVRASGDEMFKTQASIKKMFDSAQTIVSTHKLTRFSLAVDEFENMVIKSLWGGTPMGMTHFVWRNYLKRPIKTASKILDDIAQGTKPFDILKTEGYTLETLEEVNQQYREALMAIKEFQSKAKIYDQEYDDKLKLLYEHFKEVQKKQAYVKYYEQNEMSTNLEKELRDKLNSLESLPDEKKTQAVIDEIVEINEKLIKYDRETNFRKILRVSGTSFDINDIQDRETLEIANEVREALNDLVRGMPHNRSLKKSEVQEIINKLEELNKRYTLPIEYDAKELVGNEELLIQTINRNAGEINSRTLKITGMLDLIDGVADDPLFANLVLQNLSSVKYGKQYNELKAFYRTLQSDLEKNLNDGMVALQEELKHLDDFFKGKIEFMDKIYNDIINGDMAVEQLVEKYPDVIKKSLREDVIKIKNMSVMLNKHKDIFDNIQNHIDDMVKTFIKDTNFNTKYFAKTIKGIINNGVENNASADNIIRTIEELIKRKTKRRISYYDEILKIIKYKKANTVLENMYKNYQKTVNDSLAAFKNTIKTKMTIELGFDKFSWDILKGAYKRTEGLVLNQKAQAKSVELLIEFNRFMTKQKIFGNTKKTKTSKALQSLIKEYRKLQEFSYDTFLKQAQEEKVINLLETNIRQAIRQIVSNKKVKLEDDQKVYDKIVKDVLKLIQGWGYEKVINGKVIRVNNKETLISTARVYSTMQKVINDFSDFGTGRFKDTMNQIDLFNKEFFKIKGSDKLKYDNILKIIDTSGLSKDLRRVLRTSIGFNRRGVQILNDVVFEDGFTYQDLANAIRGLTKTKNGNLDKDIKILSSTNRKTIAKKLKNKEYISQVEEISAELDTFLSDSFINRLDNLGGDKLVADFKLQAFEMLSRNVVKYKMYDEIPLDLIYAKEILNLRYMELLINSKATKKAYSQLGKEKFLNTISDNIRKVSNFLYSSSSLKNLEEGMSNPQYKEFLDALNSILENRYAEMLIKLEEISTSGYSAIYKDLSKAGYMKTLNAEIAKIISESGLDIKVTDDLLDNFLTNLTKALLEESEIAFSKMYEDFGKLPNLIRNNSLESLVTKKGWDMVNDVDKFLLSPIEKAYPGFKAFTETQEFLTKTVNGKVVQKTPEEIVIEKYNLLKRMMNSNLDDADLDALYRSEISGKPMVSLKENLTDHRLIQNLIYRGEFEQLYSIVTKLKAIDMLSPSYISHIVGRFEFDVMRRVYILATNPENVELPETVFRHMRKVLKDYDNAIVNKYTYQELYNNKELKNEAFREYIENSMAIIRGELETANTNYVLREAFEQESIMSNPFINNIINIMGEQMFKDSKFDIFNNTAINKYDAQILRKLNGEEVTELTLEDFRKKKYVFFDFETLKNDYSKELEVGTQEALDASPAFQVSVVFHDPVTGETKRFSRFIELPEGFEFTDEVQGKFHNITKKEYMDAPNKLITRNSRPVTESRSNLIEALRETGIEINDDTVLFAHNIGYDKGYLELSGLSNDVNPYTFDTLPFLRSVYNRKTNMPNPNEMLSVLKNEENLAISVSKGQVYLEKHLNAIKALEYFNDEKNTGYTLEELSYLLNDQTLLDIEDVLKYEYGLPEGMLKEFHNSAKDTEVLFRLITKSIEEGNLPENMTDINKVGNWLLKDDLIKSLDSFEKNITDIKQLDNFKEISDEVYQSTEKEVIYQISSIVEYFDELTQAVKNINYTQDMYKVFDIKEKLNNRMEKLIERYTKNIKAFEEAGVKNYFSDNREFIETIIEADMEINKIIKTYSENYNRFMSAIYGDSLGYKQYNPIIRHTMVLKGYMGSDSVNYLRRLMKYEDNTGNSALNVFMDYVISGSKEAIIEKSVKDYIAENGIDIKTDKGKKLKDAFEKKIKKEIYEASNKKIHDLSTKMFSNSTFNQLEKTMDFIDNSINIQGKIFSILKTLANGDEDEFAYLSGRFFEVMRETDKSFKYFAMEYATKYNVLDHAKMIEDAKQSITSKYFSTIFEGKYLKEIPKGSYGDALRMYHDYVMGLIDNIENVPNLKQYRTIMNPDTSFTNDIYEFYKDNIQDAMDPLTHALVEKGNNVLEPEALELYKDLKKVLDNMLEDIREPLRNIKVLRDYGEAFPEYIGHLKKQLNELKKVPDAPDYIKNATDFSDFGYHQKYTISYTKRAKESKRQSEIVNSFYKGLRKERNDVTKELVAYANNTPGSNKVYKFLEDVLGEGVNWLSRNNRNTASRIIRSDHIDIILNYDIDKLPKFFKDFKNKIDLIEEALKNPYKQVTLPNGNKYNLSSFVNPTKDGMPDPDELQEVLHRLKATYYDYLTERKPEEYRKALKELQDSGFEKKILSKNKYNSYKTISTMFNRSLKDIINNFDSTEDFFRYLRNADNADITLVYVIADEATGSGIRVKRFVPKTVEDLNEILSSPQANEIGIVDTHQFQQLEKFAKQQFKFKDGSVGDMIRKFVLMPMKSSMLMTTNFIFNNIIDINLKNLVAQEGGIFSSRSVIVDTITAMKWYNIRNKYYNLAMQVPGLWANHSKNFDTEWVDAYIKHIKNIGGDVSKIEDDLNIARLVSDFLKSPSAASEPADMINRMRNNLIGHNVKQGDFEKLINRVFYGSQFSPFRYNLEVNSMAEIIGRLGMHINNINKGLTKDESFLRILKTHFNYANKSQAELMAEFIIPFNSYALRSMEFWPEALSHDNATTKTLVDTLLLAWDKDTLNDNDYALYQMSRGNIPVGNNALQTGFTFMDTMSSPYFNDKPVPEQIIRKINPLIKGAANYANGTYDLETSIKRLPLLSQANSFIEMNQNGIKGLYDILPSMSDEYHNYDDQKFVMRSSFAYRNATLNKPYYFSNGTLQFKNQFNIKRSAKDYLQWKYTSIHL